MRKTRARQLRTSSSQVAAPQARQSMPLQPLRQPRTAFEQPSVQQQRASRDPNIHGSKKPSKGGNRRVHDSDQENNEGLLHDYR